MLQPWVGISGPYWGWDAGPEVRPVPYPEPTGRTSCIPPSVGCVQREAAACVESGGLRVLVRKSALLLPPGSVKKSALYSPACTRVDGMLGTEETKPGGGRASRMPCYPPQLSHMRLRVSLGSSLKSDSRGSCPASRVQTQCHHPKSAPSII